MERILHDVPVSLESDADLLVTVVPKHESKRNAWLAASARGLAYFRHRLASQRHGAE
jgi:hypothetical protein